MENFLSNFKRIYQAQVKILDFGHQEYQ